VFDYKKEWDIIPLFFFIKHETGFEPVSRVGQAGGCAAAAPHRSGNAVAGSGG